MSQSNLIAELKQKMEKSMKALQDELAKVRTGRASTAILEGIRVDYYGTPTPLQQIATLGVPEPRMITIAPWDPKIIPDIEKAILKSGIGLNPTNDGKLIRLPIPSLTEERRKDLVKMVRKIGEESKIALRHIRREGMDTLKKSEKDGDVSKDDVKHLTEEVEKVTHQFVEKVDLTMTHKEGELMEV